MGISRRTLLASVLAGTAAGTLPGIGAAAVAAPAPAATPAASPAGRRGRQDHRRLPGLVRLRRRRRADQRLVALEPELVPDAVAGQQRHQGVARHAGVHARLPDRLRNLGNGQPATLFSSYDQQTVDTHFPWMQQNGCDTAALQRFNPNSGEGPTRDAMAAKVRSAAESYGRKFYIMYDVTGWTNMQSEIKADWTNKMSAHTASAAYARQNGKPVVCIWGFGFNDANHPWDAATCLDVINWFKSQGCYVIGGVPREWRTGVGGSRAGYLGVYHAFNMISPWMVGAIGNAADSDSVYQNINVPRPGRLQRQRHRLPALRPARRRVGQPARPRRLHVAPVLQHGPGRRAGHLHLHVRRVQRGQPDRQDRRERLADARPDSGLLALDEDGTACSSDYYLRLTGDGGRMLKGQIALTATRPTQPVLQGGDTQAPAAPGGLRVDRAHRHHRRAGLERGHRQRRGDRLPGVPGQRLVEHPGRRRGDHLLHRHRPHPVHRLHLRRHGPGRGRQLLGPSGTGHRRPPTPRPAASTWRCTGPPRRAATPRSTAAATRWTATPTPTGRAPTTPSRSGSRSTWARTTAIRRIVLTLPPAAAWSARTQTFSVLGSTDGTSFTTVAAAAGYTFDPATGNTVTVTFPADRQHPLPAAHLHRQHRLARRTAVRVPGLRGLSPARAASLCGPLTGPSGGCNFRLAERNKLAPVDQFSKASLQKPLPASPPHLPCSRTRPRKTMRRRIKVPGLRTVVLALLGLLISVLPALQPLSAAAAGSNLASGKTAAASSTNAPYTAGNLNDGNQASYWESAGCGLPQWAQIDLGVRHLRQPGGAQAPHRLGRPQPRRCPCRAAPTVPASPRSSASAAYTFDPVVGNAVTINFGATNTRYVRVNVTANTGWTAAQLSELEVFGATGSSTNLALGKTMTASGVSQTYVAANANDGNQSTLLGERQQRLPAVAAGRPRRLGERQQGGAQAAGDRLGHPHRDAVRAGQHRRQQLHRHRRLAPGTPSTRPPATR